MRSPNIATPYYAPTEPPDDPKDLPRYLREEHNKIQAAINALIEGYDAVNYAAPSKPRKGMRKYADGTSWNPGSGEGLYRYNGTSWVFLG